MKKLLAILTAGALVALALTLPPPVPTFASTGVCDPQRSRLCLGLIDFWDFEEPAGWNRLGSYQDGALFEAPGQELTQSSGTNKKLGTYAIQFDGSKQLVIPRAGDALFTQSFTLSAWIKLTSYDVGLQTILATTTGNSSFSEGIFIGFASDGKQKVQMYEEETNTTRTYLPSWLQYQDYGWHLYTVTLSPYGPYGLSRVCVYVNNTNSECAGFAYNPKVSGNDITIGGRNTDYLRAYVDGLLLSSRVWTQEDVNQYYNSGSGRAFPFY